MLEPNSSKLSQWNTQYTDKQLLSCETLNVLHNGVQGTLEYAANVGPSVDGSDQG